MFDHVSTSSVVDATVRNLLIFCKERARASLYDEDTASGDITR